MTSQNCFHSEQEKVSNSNNNNNNRININIRPIATTTKKDFSIKISTQWQSTH